MKVTHFSDNDYSFFIRAPEAVKSHSYKRYQRTDEDILLYTEEVT